MTGPRPGSLVWEVTNLELGEVIFKAVPKGKAVTRYMQQINGTVCKAGIRVELKHYIAVQPTTRAVLDLVSIERKDT